MGWSFHDRLHSISFFKKKKEKRKKRKKDDKGGIANLFSKSRTYTAGTLPNIAEDEHLQVWMRVSALPHFRKLYGKSSEDLRAGIYDIVITDRAFLPLSYIPSFFATWNFCLIQQDTTFLLSGEPNLWLSPILPGLAEKMIFSGLLIFLLQELHFSSEFCFWRRIWFCLGGLEIIVTSISNKNWNGGRRRKKKERGHSFSFSTFIFFFPLLRWLDSVFLT